MLHTCCHLRQCISRDRQRTAAVTSNLVQCSVLGSFLGNVQHRHDGAREDLLTIWCVLIGEGFPVRQLLFYDFQPILLLCLVLFQCIHLFIDPIDLMSRPGSWQLHIAHAIERCLGTI